MTNIDSILKGRDITLPTKVCLVKAMVFPVVMYGYESWTIKKAKHQRIYAFELWCWRRLLRVPWTARRSSQSILRETSPGCSLEGLMLKLKLQYFGHLIPRADLLEKTLMLGKVEGRRRRGWQRMRRLDGIIDSVDMGLDGFQELVVDREAWRAVVHGVTESDMTEWLNWTMYLSYFCVNKFEKWLKNIHLFIFHFNKVLTYQTTLSLNIDLFWIYVTSLMLSDRDWLQVTIKFWSQKLTFSLESMVTLITKQS